jgi:hexosaminidase
MIVPEIDIPGHASALLSVYPEEQTGGSAVFCWAKIRIYNSALDPYESKRISCWVKLMKCVVYQ